MVIGVEGNVHSGKTTYINKKFKNFNIIKETEFKENLSNYDRQLFYIEKEIEKKEKVKNNTVLDRTIISTAIYTLNKFECDEYKELKDIIEDGLSNDKFVIPDYLHYIVYPYKLICENHKLLCEKKGTQNTLIDYNYYLMYSLFFSCSNSFERIIETNNYRQVIVYKNDIYKDITKPIKISNKVYDLNSIISKLNNLSLEDKLKEIDNIMSITNLNDYVTKIICDVNILDDTYIKDKPILLIDIFYEIKEAIKRGEL